MLPSTFRIRPRTARYHGDQGCTILPRGTEQIFFEPVDIVSPLPDPKASPWPLGDVDAYGRYAALDWAMSQKAQNTRALVVVYRGKIIGERYGEGFTKDTPQISGSQGKSITAALIGVLVAQGELTLAEPAPIAEWQGPDDPRREIRVRDLLNMSSGLEFENYSLARPDSWSAANEHFRHTTWRADPIAFVFGLRTLEEIEAPAFPGRLSEVLATHFTR